MNSSSVSSCSSSQQTSHQKVTRKRKNPEEESLGKIIDQADKIPKPEPSRTIGNLRFVLNAFIGTLDASKAAFDDVQQLTKEILGLPEKRDLSLEPLQGEERVEFQKRLDFNDRLRPQLQEKIVKEEQMLIQKKVRLRIGDEKLIKCDLSHEWLTHAVLLFKKPERFAEGVWGRPTICTLNANFIGLQENRTVIDENAEVLPLAATLRHKAKIMLDYTTSAIAKTVLSDVNADLLSNANDEVEKRNSLLEKLKSLLTSPVFWEPFVDTKTLPCGHSLNKKEIDRLIPIPKDDDAPVDDDADVDKYKCPLCRNEFEKEELVDNATINQLSNAVFNLDLASDDMAKLKVSIMKRSAQLAISKKVAKLADVLQAHWIKLNLIPYASTVKYHTLVDSLFGMYQQKKQLQEANEAAEKLLHES